MRLKDRFGKAGSAVKAVRRAGSGLGDGVGDGKEARAGVTVGSGAAVGVVCAKAADVGVGAGAEVDVIAALARIHRWTGMDGVRAAEGGEGVTGAMIRGLEFG